MKVMGIDPGIGGAFVLLNGNQCIAKVMPIKNDGKEKEIDFDGVVKILKELQPDHIYLERVMAFAMGAKAAFNFGKGFGQLETAIRFLQIPYTMVAPAQWGKEMHEGIDSELKPKAKSKKAVMRMFPHLFPEGEKIHEGKMDAVLICAYGRRKLGVTV